MRKRLISTAMALLVAAALSAQSLYVGTYNIRNRNKGDEENGNVWATRCKVLCNQVNFEAPDAFGTQEVLVQQLRDMRAALDNYDYIGVGRDDGKEAGEYSAIFYKKDHLKLLGHGNFWLNETPDTPKLGWDAACIRICTWGKFKQLKSGFKFYYFNLHMDHVGVVARREGAKLVISKIKDIAGTASPVILTGDFNVDQTNEIYRIFSDSGILKDCYAFADRRFATNGTWNDFKSYQWTTHRIDHIFVSPKFNVRRYGVVTDSYWTPMEQTEEQKAADKKHFDEGYGRRERRMISDHYPVFAKIVFRK